MFVPGISAPTKTRQMTFVDCKLGMSDCAPAIHKCKPGGSGAGIGSVSLDSLQQIAVLQVQWHTSIPTDMRVHCQIAYDNCL